jgi:hypothetical protein
VAPAILVLACSLAVQAGTDAPTRIGRFCSAPPYKLPAFEVSGEGFAFAGGEGMRFNFESVGKGYYAAPTSWTEKVVLVPALPGGPSKLRLHLALPGFEAYFRRAMRLRVVRAATAFLTWSDGSVGVGVPAKPDAAWFLLSASPASPVLGVRFPAAPNRVELRREPDGLWLVAEAEEEMGWVRFLAPLGTAPRSPTDAASLGRLLERAARPMNRLSSWTPPHGSPRVSYDRRASRVVVTEPSSEGLAAVPPAVSAAAGLGLCDVGQQGELEIRLPDGPLVLPPPSSPSYTLRVPDAAPVLPADLAALKGIQALVPPNDLLAAFAARFYMGDDAQEELGVRLGEAASKLAEAEWESWREGHSGRELFRLKPLSMAENPLLRHARAACTVAAALETRGAWLHQSLHLALRRCCEYVGAYVDWASLEPMYEGREATPDELCECLAAVQLARRVSWEDEEWECELAWLSARLALAVQLRFAKAQPPSLLPAAPLAADFYTQASRSPGFAEAIRGSPLDLPWDAGRLEPGEVPSLGTALWLAGAAAPMVLDAPPRRRLMRAEYDSETGTEYRVTLAPGPAVTLTGTEKRRLAGVSLHGDELPVERQGGARWRVRVPQLTQPAALVFRFD